MELTELVEDYLATRLLSNFELDFLEAELWETIQYIHQLNTLTKSPKKISKALDLDENSSWHLCCARILDIERPDQNGKNRVNNLKKLIAKYNL